MEDLEPFESVHDQRYVRFGDGSGIRMRIVGHIKTVFHLLLAANVSETEALKCQIETAIQR